MPIAYPPLVRGRSFDLPARLTSNVWRSAIPATNMDAPANALTFLAFVPQKRVNSNVRELGKQYRTPERTATVNPASNIDSPGEIFTNARLFDRELGTSTLRMTGVSRDAAGARLGTCVVNAFRTGSNEFAGTTTSDSNGDWSMILGGSGPFFLVKYKAGGPDVFGTSLNTLVPIPS